MKALLVADNNLVIDNISQILETAGYDVIIYNWLLKALDNIEEISPHLIVVSAKDYPRHWKTLAQYASMGFRSYKPQIILYAEGGLNDDDIQKAKTLNIRGVFESVDVKGLDQLRNILTKESDIFSGSLTEEEIPTVDNLLTTNEENLPEEHITISEKQESIEQEPQENSAEEQTESKAENESQENTAEPQTETEINICQENTAETQAEKEINICQETSVEEPKTETEIKISQASSLEETSENTSEISEELQENKESQDNFTAETNLNLSEQEQSIPEETQTLSESLQDITAAQNLTQNNLETSENTADEQSSIQKNLVCSFMFTNPLSGELVTGYAFNFDGKTFIFKADIPEFVSNLSTGTQISCASLKLKEEIKAVKSLVRENAAEMLLELV